MELFNGAFLPVDSFARVSALVALAALAFGLSFAVVPLAGWQAHFFQLGIFASAFVFGPLAGAAVGALSSSYGALLVLHNPWMIIGNAILGFSAAWLYTRTTPFKAAMGAFALQLPWLAATDVFLMGMPVAAVAGIAMTLFAENVLCALVAASVAPQLRMLLSRS